MEAYRSGHNEPHSKCGYPTGYMSSNLIASAKFKNFLNKKVCFAYLFVLLLNDDLFVNV